MGREIIARLRECNPSVPILAVASKPRAFAVNRYRYHSVAWNHDTISAWRPTLAIHLAYLTRELEVALGTREYELRNQRVTHQALQLYSIETLNGVVVASSGAAVALRDTTYGRLKSSDEVAFLTTGRAAAIPTVVARIWSASGAYCTKPNEFAFFDLIHQTLHEPVVQIRSSHEVWRQYIDAGEFLGLCLGAVATGATGVIDSGGELIELGELAQRIQSVMGISRPVDRPPLTNGVDSYYSKSETMKTWAQRLGVVPSSLDRQIVRSSG